jgi:serpin B
VNEEGTEAAAATAIIVAELCCARIEPPKPKFIADHPFAFLLVSNQNTQILFNGIFQA